MSLVKGGFNREPTKTQEPTIQVERCPLCGSTDLESIGNRLRCKKCLNHGPNTDFRRTSPLFA
jgi:tRNA(Ile2) C34 agmatinyltransferase TiaS